MRGINIDLDSETGGGSYREVANRTARLALTDVAIGDIVKELSTKSYYILTALPASNSANWRKFYTILGDGYPIVTPSAGTATIDFVAQEVATIKLDCFAQTADVAVTINPFPLFAQVIVVQFGPTAINLNFGSAKQAGGGGGIVAGLANAKMLITVFYDASDIYISPQIYA